MSHSSGNANLAAVLFYFFSPLIPFLRVFALSSLSRLDDILALHSAIFLFKVVADSAFASLSILIASRQPTNSARSYYLAFVTSAT